MAKPGAGTCLGGCGGDLDRELEGSWPLAALAELIMDLLARYIVVLTAAAAEHASPIVIALICAWGKHRSRWLVERLRRWLEQLGDLAFAFQVVHLSDLNRMLEVRHADQTAEGLLRIKGE